MALELVAVWVKKNGLGRIGGVDSVLVAVGIAHLGVDAILTVFLQGVGGKMVNGTLAGAKPGLL